MKLRRSLKLFENYLSDAKTKRQILYLINILNVEILDAKIFNRQRERVRALTEIKEKAEEKFNEIN